jgi:mannitol-specific phosphotransferase system IIBC component
VCGQTQLISVIYSQRFSKIKKRRNGEDMQKDTEKQQQRKEKEKFNQSTHKEKPENQNQTHNVVREGIGPQNQKR